MKFLSGQLRLEASVGVTIEKFAADMVELSERLGIMVVCEINYTGVDMWAIQGMDPSAVASIWRSALAARERNAK